MNNPTVWDLIQQSKFDEACALADVEFEQDKDIFPLRNKVFALLLLGKFERCIEVSKQIIELNRIGTDSDYIFLGVAFWLNQQFKLAIESWRAGLPSQYTDAAGGVEIPLLLFYAAIVTGDTSLKAEALGLLKKTAKSKRIANWPGPIALFILGKISVSELRLKIDVQPILQKKQACEAEFFVAIDCIARSEIADSIECFKRSSSFGLVCSTKASLYLAKFELERRTRQQ